MTLVHINGAGVAHVSILVGLAAVLLLAIDALPTVFFELVLLLFLVVYYFATRMHGKVQWYRQTYLRLAGSFTALPLQRRLALIILGVPLTAIVVSDVIGVGFAISGIVAYYLLHSIGKRQGNCQKAAKVQFKVAPLVPTATTRFAHPYVTVTASSEESRHQLAGGIQRETSAIQAQVAQSEITGRDAEVQDIVRSDLPTAADDLVIRKIINHVRKSIASIVPEAQVFGSASGNIAHLGAHGLKPEVEIIVMASPEVLTERLKVFFLRGPSNGQRCQKSIATLNPDMLQKTATRLLSQRLTCMRFWRSQFAGPEPKVVLLAPAELGFCPYPIRINFSVNNPYPQRLSTVLAKGNARSKELILLVTRWANSRGIANASKGHLRSYAYSLLVIYFLREKTGGDLIEKSTAEVFGDFVQYYCDWFDQSHSDVVAITFGDTTKQASRVESNIFGIPFIEDPFDTNHNLASTMTADGVARLKEEFTRASRILDASPTTFGNLLELWNPQRSGEDQ